MEPFNAIPGMREPALPRSAGSIRLRGSHRLTKHPSRRQIIDALASHEQGAGHSSVNLVERAAMNLDFHDFQPAGLSTSRISLHLDRRYDVHSMIL